MSALDASWSFLKAKRLPTNPETTRLAEEAARRAKVEEEKRARQIELNRTRASRLDEFPEDEERPMDMNDDE